VSDSNGRYSVELIGPGVYQAQVSVDGYAWVWSPRVRAEGGTVELNLKVSRGGALSGAVLDPSGRPVTGAKVIPLSMARSVVERSEARFEGEAGAVATGADGRFTIEHLAGGAETVKVLAADYAPLDVGDLKITEGQTTDAGTMKLTVGGAVKGVVYDSDGVAASGVTLQFQDSSGYSGPDEERVGRVATVVSGDGGRFRVEHLAQQVLYVNVADRGQKQGVISRAVRPANGRTARLDYGGPTALSGRLLLADKPLASKRIILASGYRDGPVAMMGTTDADGRFVFHGAPLGRYKLFCQIGTPNSEWTPARDVQTSGQPLDLGDTPLDPGNVVFSFTADDEADLKLVRSVRIVPGQSEMTDSGEGPRPRPDASSPGTWRATNVPAGKFTAVIYPGTYTLSAPFERKAGAAETSVTIHIPHGSATLALTVSKPAGADQSQSQALQLRNLDNSVQFLISSDPSRPSPKVPPGIYQAIDGLRRLPLDGIAPITLKENDSQELHVDWPLPAPSMAAVSFRIWSPDGILVTDANVNLLDPNGVAAKNEGNSQFGPVWAVRPGSCRAIINLPNGKSITRQIDIPAPMPRFYGSRWTEMDLVTE
jgi:hypothetical protein